MVSGRSTQVHRTALVFFVALAVFCAQSPASITPTGSIDPAYDSSDPWVVNEGDEFIVGFEADGSLSITGGSDVTVNMPVYIGDYAWEAAGTTGTFLLTGLGSTFSVDPEGESMLFIGPLAEGYLNVEDQAILTSHDAIIGGSPLFDELDQLVGVVAGEGHATVLSGAQWNTGDGWLTVGGAGIGELTIDGGASVTTNTAEVGLVPDSDGEVAVDGLGSWTVTEDLIVGVWGQGNMAVAGGGQVESARGWIGGVDTDVVTYEEQLFEGYGVPSGIGSVTVSGEDEGSEQASRWTIGEYLVVGGPSEGSLSIEEGGIVTAPEVFIGGMPLRLGEEEEYSRDLLATGVGTVNVRAGGILDVTSEETLFVGYSGTGTLNVEAGGSVTSGTVVLGAAPDAEGTILVTGEGSTLTAEDVQVGAWGTGSLTISDGGTVSADYMAIGGMDASDVDELPQAMLDDFGDALGVGTVTVTGDGSLLEVLGDDTLIVGSYGTGTLNVEAGGDVVSVKSFIGGYAEYEDVEETETATIHPGTGTVTVTGEGSTWESEMLYVGAGGEGTLNVQDGGVVGGNLAVVGLGPDGTGTVTVHGSGSLWDVTDAGEFSEELDGVLIVGAWGEGVLNVEAGGRVNAVTLYVGGTETSEVAVGVDWGLGDPDGDGTVTVTGDGSILSILPSAEDEIPVTTYVGYSGEGTLNILDGGRVESDVAVVGVLADGVGVVTVDGEGSTWAILGADAPHVGLTAEGQGDLTISNGGQVDVEGENALLLVADAITIGSEGEGSAMAISDGGQVASGSGIIGAGADATGTVTVAGDNSRWDMAESLVVGAYGEGTLEIGWGGQVTADEIFVGGFAPVPGLGDDIREYLDPDAELPTGTGTITISGAAVLQSEGLSVGLSGQGTLEIDNGAHVISEWAELGVLPDAVGVVQVDNGTWSITDSLVVGAYGQGDLAILDGTVVADEVYVGGAPLDFFVPSEEPYDPDLLPSGTGSITVSGSFGHLYVTGENTLYVGYSGTGTLNVDAGGDVTAESVVIGAAPDAEGTVLVTGAGSTLTTQDMTIGAWGEGELTIADGAEVTAEYVTIGGFDATDVDDLPQEVLDEFGDGLGTGVVTVMGDGSSLSVTGDFPLTVGYFGTGTLTASEGGLVESDSLMIGAAPDATGTVTVDDAELAIAGSTVVGGWGQGNLTVSGGSEASVGTLYIGGFDEDEAPSEWVEAFGDSLGTGTVAVTGAGSVLDVTEDNTVYVGYSGNGTLEILNGGRVNSHSGVVGVEEGGNGLVTVAGTGSLWMITGGGIGMEQSAVGEGEVIVSNGGQIVVTGGTGGLDVAGDIIVGSEGDGSSMSVLNGADVYSEGLIIGGYDPDLDPLDEYFDAELADGSGTVTVDGDGSVWDAENVLVGFSGDGTLNITNGGEVMDDFAAVGVMPDVTGYVSVDSGSRWVTDVLAVGIWGSGTVDVLGGSRVYAEDVFIGGLPLDLLERQYSPDLTADGTGVVNVSGEESRLYATALSSLYVGYSGDGTLNVTDGGYVESNTAGIGVLPDSTGSATIDGGVEGEGFLPSTWQNYASMFVGGYGTGELTISNGGLVDINHNLYIGGFRSALFGLDIEQIGYDPNGTGTVTVTGEGSTLYGTGLQELHVGYSGQGTLNIEDGGYVESGIAAIGALPGSTGEVIVDGVAGDGEGAPSTWENLGSMVVGSYGDGSLTVRNGGEVYVLDTLYIGGFDTEAENFPWLEESDPRGRGEVTVIGDGSLLEVGGDYTLHVGHSSDGRLDILDGGMVINQNGYIGTTQNGSGEVYVEDATWENNGDLYVGYSGQGSLTIANGGYVRSSYGYLGCNEEGEGTVTVTGTNSLWEMWGSLYIGGSCGPNGDGLLNVSDGGRVVAQEVTIWETGTLTGDGTVSVLVPTTVHNYGVISPGNDGIGTLTIEGSVVFHEGSIYHVEIANDGTSDKLQAEGTVNIEGGTVRVASQGTIMGEHEYEIINAYGVQGQFDDLDTALLNFSFSEIGLDYNDVSVWLRIAAANFDDPNIARTYNQRQVAGALQTIGGQGGNDVTDAVQDIETVDGVRGAYDQLSGQTRPPLAPMTIAGSSKFLGTVTSRVQTVKTGLVAGAFDSKLLAAAGPDQALGGSTSRGGQDFAVGNGTSVLADKRWGLWGRGYGLYGDRDSGDELPGYGYHIFGGSFGVDYQFTETLLAGLVAGVSEGDVDFDNSRDSTDFGAAHIGLYGSFAWDVWNVDAVATYANLDYETRRFVDLLDERLSGNFDGSEFAAYVEVSRDYKLAPNLTLAPLASVQYTYLDLDSYTETGGVSALSFDGQTHESIRGSLGARLTKRLIETAGDFRADVQLRGRWVHEFGDDRASVDTSFASDPTVVFTVKDDAISRDSAVLGLGFLTELNDRTRAYFDYDTRLNSDETVHVLSASLQYRW